MKQPIQLLSTDFDGTLHAEFEDPPIPEALQQLIGGWQEEGMVWVINTGRDLSSLMETLGRDRIPMWPDYVVTVEREIYRREHTHYVGMETWNTRCQSTHASLFAQVRSQVPELMAWIAERYDATLFEDAFSPLCLIAQSSQDAKAIHEFLEAFCARFPGLTVVRNDVYARFCHADFNKGTALAEISRRLGVRADHIIAAGDHLNDLPMLRKELARWLIAPSNAVPEVKETVLGQGGFVSGEPHGHGLLRGLEHVQKAAARV